MSGGLRSAARVCDMAWLDTPEEDRIVVLYDGDTILAVGHPAGLVWLWDQYRLLLSRVKVPSGCSVVMVGFDEFDSIVPGTLMLDRDRFPEDGWTPTGRRKFGG